MDQATHTTITVDKSVLDVVSAYIALVKKHDIHFEQAILFGSQATGKSHKQSDIDLCLVSDTFRDKEHDVGVALHRLTYDFNMSMDIIPMTPADLSEKYSTLAHEIRTHGIRIV